MMKIERNKYGFPTIKEVYKMNNIYEMCKVKPYNKDYVKCLTKNSCSYKIPRVTIKGDKYFLCRKEDYKDISNYLKDFQMKENIIDKMKSFLKKIRR